MPLRKPSTDLQSVAGDLSQEETVAAIVAIYVAAWGRLRSISLGMKTTDPRRAYFSGILANLENELRLLNAKTRKVAAKAIDNSARIGHSVAKKRLQLLGVTTIPKLTSTAITSSSATTAMQLTLDLLNNVAGMKKYTSQYTLAAQQRVTQNDRITKKIADGLGTGARRRDISSGIVSDLKTRISDGKVVDSAGRVYDVEYYAEMVTRTRIKAAANQAMLLTGVNAGLDLVQIDVHDAACPKCQPYSGKVYSLSGHDKRFPRLAVRFPLHPNCVCSYLWWTESAIRELPQYDALMDFSNSDDVVTSFADYKKKLGVTS